MAEQILLCRLDIQILYTFLIKLYAIHFFLPFNAVKLNL